MGENLNYAAMGRLLVSDEIAFAAVEAALEKKAQDPVILNMEEVLTGVADRFVILGASNARQVKTIAEEIERVVKGRLGLAPRAIEGIRECEWVLLDYGDSIIHVFLDPVRAHYDLERLWNEVPKIELPATLMTKATVPASSS